MAYIVCHAEKQSNLLSMPHHIDRIGVYQKDGSVTVYPDDYEDEELRGKSKHPQIMYPERHKWNRGGGASCDGFTKSWLEEIVKLERSPQDNASPTVCFNNSAGGEFWVELRNSYPNDEDYYAKCEEYFYDCRVALDELYPDAKTLKWVTHYEESEPHLHTLKPCILKAPKRLSKKDKAKKKKPGEAVLKFSSGEFLGGPKGLVKLQDTIYEKVGKKWGLARGECGSEAKHTDQLEWQRELSKKDKQLTEGLRIINEIGDKNAKDSERIAAQEEEVKKMISEAAAEKERLIKEGQEERKRLITEGQTKADIIVKIAQEEANENTVFFQKKEEAIEKRERDVSSKEVAVLSKELFVKGAEKAITDMKKKSSGENQIAVSVLEILNVEGVRGEERKSFFKEFFKKIPDFVRDIIKTIRKVSEKDIKQEDVKTQKMRK